MPGDTGPSDYQEYLEFFDDDKGRRPKLTRVEYARYEDEFLDLTVWESLRGLKRREKARLRFLMYLLQMAGAPYGKLPRAYKDDAERMRKGRRKGAGRLNGSTPHP